MADRLTQLQDAVNSVGRKYYVKIASINPIQGGEQKRLRSTFSSNYCRKAAIDYYFNGL